MKIAIIAPAPVPYTIGGAEKMWWGLQRELNTNTSHQAEIIKLPTKEHSFWDLIDSYEAFAQLDLSAFDLVISGKYPAWMVSHPRHICYMQHRLRGLYDSYHFNNLPSHYQTQHPDVLALQKLMQTTPRRDPLSEVFSRLHNLRYHPDVPEDAFAFPGPFIKQVLEWLDAVGLSTDAIERHYAISHTVANRPSYFPAGAEVRVVYPPTNLEGLHCGSFDYIFTASRLDGPKRVHLLIEAMRFVKADVELRIAGEGPDRARLEAAARDDKRIRLVGFRSDAELVEDYANALAVAFLPQAEDYGLITVEAMMSGKPVITTRDAGGPTEFVDHGRTGLCVDPSAEQLAAAIDQLAYDRTLARRMGESARARVSGITSANMVEELLRPSSKFHAPHASRRTRPRKLTVATTFGVTPVRGGGQARIFHLYKNLAPTFEVELVTLGQPREQPFTREVAPGLREIRIPKSKQHTDAEESISGQVDWFSITDVVFPELAHLTPAYGQALERSARDAEVVVASHPYALNVIEAVTDKPLWYEAQDVEYVLKRSVIPATERGLRLVEEVHEVEERCCHRAALIAACSEEDAVQLRELYGIAEEKIRVVPNGTNTDDTPFVPRSRAAEVKRRLGMGDEFLAMFIGSWHRPNLDATEAILRLAREAAEVQFLVLGSAGGAFRNRAKPDNVAFFGVVDDDTKALVLSAADLALNPMRNGSGTNLKMLEYAAAGIPILSTETGLRGLRFRSEEEVFVSHLDDFAEAIVRVRATPPADLQAMTVRARKRAEVQFDWRGIGRRFLESI